MADLYANYAALAAARVEGTDYRIITRVGTTLTSHIAIHGGGIEIGTLEAADAAALAGGHPYYAFEGLLASGNADLHITSVNFDEPRAIALQSGALRTVSWHGAADATAGVAETWVGGLDVALRDAVIQRLTAAGFTVSLATDPEIAGVSPDNISNRNRYGMGVQLELSTQQRKDFFPGGDWSRPVRESGQRTAAFTSYVAAVNAAVADFPPPTITTQADADRERIGVTLAGFAADGLIEVVRVHPGGARYAVRGPITVTGGDAFGWDYEPPFRTSVTYEALDLDGAVVTSAAVALPGTEAWLRAPGLPGYDLPVELCEKPKPTRARPSAVLRPLGRTSAVVLTAGALQSAEYDLRVRTYGHEEAAALEGLVEAAPTALLVVPGLTNPWQYVAILGLAQEGLVTFRPADLDGADPDDPGAIYEWTLAVVVTDPPVGDLFGDPTASYQVLLDTYATYQAVKDAHPDYLDVLKGE